MRAQKRGGRGESRERPTQWHTRTLAVKEQGNGRMRSYRTIRGTDAENIKPVRDQIVTREMKIIMRSDRNRLGPGGMRPSKHEAAPYEQQGADTS